LVHELLAEVDKTGGRSLVVCELLHNITSRFASHTSCIGIYER
jgi:hypothetical protein